MFLALNGYQSNIDMEDGLNMTMQIVEYQEDFEILKDIVVAFFKVKERIYEIE
ncbi:hypothetical protein [Staphylococcus sp. IVB6240]|nr:hypothetical protein [Staphylococcus sp. IVB6240]UXR71639.1 hypothetical protein MUA88_10820 [Staphylococcus sp. IVB6240]